MWFSVYKIWPKLKQKVLFFIIIYYYHKFKVKCVPDTGGSIVNKTFIFRTIN